MSVTYSQVEFRNVTGLSIDVSVEAPIGAPAANRTVGPSSTATIRIGVADCRSTKITASDPTHGPFSQTFAVASPSSGVPAYLVSVNTRYNIGDLQGLFVAATEGGVRLRSASRNGQSRRKKGTTKKPTTRKSTGKRKAAR